MHLARMKEKDTYRQCVHGKRHRERKWATERFERMRNRVRKDQFSREGAAAVSADAAREKAECKSPI